MGIVGDGATTGSALWTNWTTGNSYLDFRLGGTTSTYTKMRIDTLGNVGIGTTSPASGTGTPLTLSSPTGYVGIRLNGTGSYANDWDLYASGDGAGLDFFGIYDRTNLTYRLVATNTGNVGIGTTAPAAYLGFNAESYSNGTEDSSSIRWNDSGTADALIQTWINGTSGIGMLLGGNTYVNSSGAIAKFDSSKNSSCFIADPPNNKASIWMSETTMSAPVEVFTVNANDSTYDGGCVGININNPAARAYFIVRPLATSGTTLELTNAAGSRRWFYIMDGHYGYQGVEQIYANGGYNRYFSNTSGTAVGSIVVNSGSTAFNTTSDYRLKDNPQPLTGSGEFIDALQPKTWTWNHGDGGTGVGFIAHEAAEVGLGLCVTGEKDAESIDKVWNEETQEFDEQVTPTYQQVDYSNGELIANMVAELQSLRARVAELENN